MNALLTDLYELTMAAGYFETGRSDHRATFEFTIRHLPPNRNYVLAAGLSQAVDYLLNLKFTAEEIDYLRSLPQFARISPAFFDYLAQFHFTGDLFAVPEGTPLFAGEPLLFVRGPIIEAQIPETYLLAMLSFQSLIAGKAARMVEAAGGRPVVEFGTRRAHTPEAGVLGARASYIGGCQSTSNVLAGQLFGIPLAGTAAHSWVMSFCSEISAFRHLQKVMGEHAVYVIDTYDPLTAARRVVELGRPLWGVRLDSGDLLSLSRQVRGILNEGGLTEAKIMASGDLDEYKIRALVAAGAPIDAFGVGTQLATSADAPHLSTAYKLVEQDIHGIQRFTAKFSPDKISVPGAKQVFRDVARDVIARSGECGKGEALLRPVLLGGRLVEPLPSLEQARDRAAQSIAQLPPALRQLEVGEAWPVILSRELRELIERTRQNLGG